MATWKDGPRHAPPQRPEGFAEPEPSVSLEAEPETPRDISAPVEQPRDYQEDDTLVTLGDFAPITVQSRDPQEPFTTQTAALTSQDTQHSTLPSLEPSHERSPGTPFTVASSMTKRSASAWAPPPDSLQPVAVIYPVRASDAVTSAYPPLLITLVVCGVIASMSSIAAMVVAGTAIVFMLSKVRYRFQQLRNLSIAVGIILVTVLVATFLMNTTRYNMDFGLGWWVFGACWGIAAMILFFQYMGIRQGETPSTHRRSPGS